MNQRLVELAEKQLALEVEVSKVEALLKEKQEELRHLSENVLPEAMGEEEVLEFTMEDGRKVSLATSYNASISEANRDIAFSWLRENGFDGLIKRSVSMEFGRGEDDMAEKYTAWLARKYPDRSIKDKASIHHSTLRAFVRECVEEGRDIPMDAFGVFIRNYTKITEVEVKKPRRK
jgi:hypothetical protein